MQLKSCGYNVIVMCCLLSILSCNQNQNMLTHSKLIPYPSGSALSFLNGKLYLMGDDAINMLVLDEDLNVLDSIPMNAYPAERIPKKIKPDMEAITVVRYKKENILLLLGSGSAGPERNVGTLVQPANAQKENIDLSVFYERLRQQGIKDLNIEAVAALPGGIVIASRGNRSFPRNFLVFTSQDFFEKQDSAAIKVVRVGTNTDTSLFNGVSGLDYAAGADKLILTISSENTFNSYEDGSIGKSYLWVINDITNRKRVSHINPDLIIDLDQMDERFKGHKIESVSVIKETRQALHLVLTADDDNGQTLLFKLILNKK
jgi:hypothetical protein